MECINPVIRGFYPDPSVCAAEEKFYLVNSSFEYFPGLPVFESRDLVHWTQIGHCLTRQSQLDLRGVEASGGIFAPTIRYDESRRRFYVVVTNVSGGFGNFYVYTDDIHSGNWSEPVKVERGGIDPSLLFDGGKTYFLSNGTDDFGEEGISLCEIDIETGAMLTKAKCISKGCGGRYLEGPHLYHIGGWYYLMVAEGGTEYGHMECMLRARDVWGPYQKCPHNPILTNRNLGGYIQQAAGHADLVRREDGQWFMVHLAFRQIDRWLPFHNLGRETYLMPVSWTSDGWPQVGSDGTCRSHWSLDGGTCTTLEEPEYPSVDWALEADRACYLRLPDFSAYSMSARSVRIRGGEPLGSTGTVSLVGMRQTEHRETMTVTVDASGLHDGQEAGLTAYMSEGNHFDVCVQASEDSLRICARLVIDGNVVPCPGVPLTGSSATLRISADALCYKLQAASEDGSFTTLSSGHSKFLSSEVTCGFTGTVLALYCQAASGGESGSAAFSW